MMSTCHAVCRFGFCLQELCRRVALERERRVFGRCDRRCSVKVRKSFSVKAEQLILNNPYTTGYISCITEL